MPSVVVRKGVRGSVFTQTANSEGNLKFAFPVDVLEDQLAESVGCVLGHLWSVAVEMCLLHFSETAKIVLME